MSNSSFYLDLEQNHQNADFIRQLEEYCLENNLQAYLINSPLPDSKYKYDYEGGAVLLIPKHKIMILNMGGDEDEFEEYYLDLIEDISSISDKYQYKSVIGRSRKWKEEVVSINSNLFDDDIDLDALISTNYLNKSLLQKKTELLISLLTGSINDIERVKDNVPENILDKIKQKILLFDGEQTRFVYQEKEQSRITIQGLSGTGKTELLLHKLKDLYLKKNNSRILFTCHNRILAASLRKRIPEFFNFMKVEEQIKWKERLWCVHAWGFGRDFNSGAYRYICHKYELVFHTWSVSMSFSKACSIAIDELKEKDIGEDYAFDYVLVDESQDFPKEFISLCQMVTKNAVYVAGDIFQSIFDENIISEIKPDFLLSKCYRTDPRTLMFAHAVGMGLFEEKKLRWLSDDQWGACGYIVEKNDEGNIYNLKREPLRRFEDLTDSEISSMEIVHTKGKVSKSSDDIIELIEKIIEQHPTVSPNDIGIVFTGGNKSGFKLADILELKLPKIFGWEINKAWETKSTLPDTVLISNKNNVKGLEFPFIICVTSYISDMPHERNALYMLLTRSFITSYLLVPEGVDDDKLNTLDNGLQFILKNGYLEIEAPNKEQLDSIQTNIDYDSNQMSIFDITENIFDELDVPPLWQDPITSVIKVMPKDPTYENIKELVEANIEGMAIQNEGTKSE